MYTLRDKLEHLHTEISSVYLEDEWLQEIARDITDDIKRILAQPDDELGDDVRPLYNKLVQISESLRGTDVEHLDKVNEIKQYVNVEILGNVTTSDDRSKTDE